MRDRRTLFAFAMSILLPGMAAASVAGARIPGATQITDINSNVWTVAAGVIAENGKPAGYSAGVALLLYFNNVIYQQNTAGNWWSWSGNTWVAGKDPRSISVAGATVPSSTQLVDGSHNVWTTASGIVYENGTTAGYTANVELLLAFNTMIYQRNDAGHWWAWSGGNWLASADPRTAATPPKAGLAIKVSGSRLVDQNGNTVQLRGVNVSGLESVAIQGWDPGNPWGGQTGDATPNWSTIKTWKANAVRLPLNEASWLGLSCVDIGGSAGKAGAIIHADPGGNYQATVESSVAQATAAGLYVILDLHWAAPNDGGTPACPTIQNAMADADHSPAFWTSVAQKFKGNPAVIFELFNEPFLGADGAIGDTTWQGLLGGSSVNQLRYAGGAGVLDLAWDSAGMQALLDTVRATGSTNVVLTSTLTWSSQMDGWLESKPTDPAGQLGAVWHAYPSWQQYPTLVGCEPDNYVSVGMPQCAAVELRAVKAIVSAGYPVVITEFGDAIGGTTAPSASVVLPFADSNGISYLGWTWDDWSGATANVLITDAAGDPTAGFGTYVKQHYLCRAEGTANCP
jgi:aryl-phospho-beta-D-glucosidase BglC (GH1 family)